MSDKIKFTALGGAREIGANSFMLEFGDKLFIIDSGSTHETGWKSVPEWTDIPCDPDAIFITHAHNDHIGTLLPLMTRYPGAKVFMTEGTYEIAKLMLDDQVKISTRTKANERIPYAGLLAYYSKHKEEFLSRMECYKYLQEFKLGENDNFCFKFHDAGHILGSSMIEISDGERTVLHTGDYNTAITFSESGINLASLPKNVDMLISEATYGATIKNKNNREIALNNLAEGINHACNHGGNVLIPTFALGRTQEILLAINILKKEKRIPENINAFSVGLSNKISEVYNDYYGLDLKYTAKRGKLEPETEEPAIFLLTSGFLMPETLSSKFLEQIKDNPAWAVVFPSSYAKKKTEEKVKECKAAVYQADFSAHATKESIINFVKAVKPKTLVFIHGDKNAVENLSKSCRSICNVCSPYENGETVYLQKNKNGNTVLKRSSDERALVITVGTSLQTNYRNEQNKNLDKDLENGIIDGKTYLKKKSTANLCYNLQELCLYLENNPKRASAELNTLYSSEIKEDDYDRVFLISTEGGKINAFALEQHFASKGKEAETVIVDSLDAKETNIFYSEGLRNLVFAIVNIIFRFKDSLFIVSGGYKAVIAYTNLAASIFRKKAYYMHETSHSTENMPLLPIGLDFNMYKIFRDDMEAIVNGANIEYSMRQYSSLPEYFRKALIQEDCKSHRYVYSPLGMILNAAYRDSLRKMNKRIEGFPMSVLYDYDESPQESNAVSAYKFRNTDMRQKINAVLNFDFVYGITFSEPFELSEEILKENPDIKSIKIYSETYNDKNIYMQFISSNRGKIKYFFSGMENSIRKYQIMKIKTVGGLESSVIEILGQHLTLNTNKEDQQD